MKSARNNNFETRIIQESKEKRAKRIKEAISKHCENSTKQLSEWGLTEYLKIDNMDYMNQDKIDEANAIQKKQMCENSKNGIICAMLIGGLFALAAIGVVIIKILEHFK